MPNLVAFKDLSLSPAMQQNLLDLGYKQLTDIQAAALPAVLNGQDVIGQAKTGSGKTVAFGLGVIQGLDVNRFYVQTLVLCPTRELADQVARELRKLARAVPNVKILTLCGGMPFGPQVGSLEHGAHIVVGTPGRIDDHIRKGNLKLERVKTLVLDEADRMLDMGFQDTLDAIVAEIPQQRQTLLFSATYPDTIGKLADRVMQNPLMIKVASAHTQQNIDQRVYKVAGEEERIEALLLVLAEFKPASTVIFCNTKKETTDVANYLRQSGLAAIAINGDMEQRDRDQALVCFSNNSVSILVATDVAARGLDIDKLELVLNYHISRDPEVHVHRIGRTGRAGEKGVAVTLLAEKEAHKLPRLADVNGVEPEWERLPDIPYVSAELAAIKAPMITLQIDGGKKQKVRPGDIVGALTGNGGVPGEAIGKINVFDMTAYVAVKREVTNLAIEKISKGKLKGRNFRVRRVSV